MMNPPHSTTVHPVSGTPAQHNEGSYLLASVEVPGTQHTPLVGNSAAIERLRQQIDRLGPHFRRVLLTGEAGSHRERVARALRAASPAAAGPFVNLAHGDLEEIASLWKQDPRVARMTLRRLVHSAAGGMIWIDDIASLSSAAQTLLLRLLDERSSDGERLRIAAGTTVNLKAQAAAGTLSHELRLALASVELHVPPLRARIEDLDLLAREAVHSIAREYGLEVGDPGADLIEQLRLHPWEGNETELENVLRMAVLSRGNGTLRAEDLSALEASAQLSSAHRGDVPDRLQDVIDRHLLYVLASCDGNKLRAADRLGISRSTLYRMLEACALAQTAA